jgi:hypothetical protein
MKIRKGQYLTRESYYDAMYHQFDDIKNTGFNWRAEAFNKSMSSYFLSDSKRESIISRFQIFLVYIMDYSSKIKKAFNYTADKNYKYLN